MAKTVQSGSNTSDSGATVKPQDHLSQHELTSDLQDNLRDPVSDDSETVVDPKVGQLEEALQAFSEARGLVDFFALREEAFEMSSDVQGKQEITEDINEQIEIVTKTRQEILQLAQVVSKDALDPYYQPLLEEILLLDTMEKLRKRGFGDLRGKEAPELNTATNGILELVKGMNVRDVPDLSTDESSDRNEKMGVGRIHDLTVTDLTKRQAQTSQYIRFVKATKLRGSELSSTVPGYVTFGNHAEVEGDIGALRQAVEGRHSAGAQWSFDGPGKGVDSRGPSSINIVDEPGEISTVASHFPYILKLDFVGVVYDPITLRVLRKAEYSDYHEELTDPHAAARKKKLQELRAAKKNPPTKQNKVVNPYI